MREKNVAVIVTAVLFLGMLGVVPQYVYNHYLKESSTSDEIHVAWEEQYPFEESETEQTENEEQGTVSPMVSKRLKYRQDTILDTYKALVQKVEDKIENGFNNNFPFRIKIVEANGKLLKLMGIKKISGSDTVVDLGNGYLTLIQEEKDVSYAADEVSEFAEWLNRQEADFLFVQAPFKVEENSTELSGYTDYSNENANEFLAALNGSVSTFDLREEIQNEYDVYKELFYRTDHHWLPETGLWATRKIAEKLNAEFGYEINTELFEAASYGIETYENWLLGSLGKKVTLGYADAENLDIYFPLYPTNLNVKVQSLNVDTTGSFYDSLIYQRVLQTKNYYDWDAYWAYGYGDRGLIRIDNLDIEQGQHILMIKDSFADTVYPFLSLGVDEMTVIDMRHFTGSLRTYIEENKPDMVIFLCNPSSFPDGSIERSSHNQIFDLQ